MRIRKKPVSARLSGLRQTLSPYLRFAYKEAYSRIHPRDVLLSLLPPRFFPNPKVAVVEVTNRCNLTCVMCSQKYMTRAKGKISFELYKQVIDQIAGRVPRVHLYSTGEPLVHPDLARQVAYAKEAGVQTVNVSTNGLLLSERRSRQLIDAGLDLLQVSVEGSTVEEYEAIRQGSSYQKVHDNLQRFMQLRDGEPRPTVEFHLLVYKGFDKQGFADLWRGTCDKVRVDAMQPMRNIVEGGDVVEALDVPEVSLYPKTRRAQGCSFPFHMIVVSFDGAIGMCCGDFNFQLKMGDVLRDGIIETYRNAAYSRIRRSFVRKSYDETPCAGCPTLYSTEGELSLFKMERDLNRLINS